MSEPVEGFDEDGNPTSALVVTSHVKFVGEHGPELDLATGGLITDLVPDVAGETGPEDSAEGGEPSVPQETEEPAGTDSSASSNPDARSDASSGNETPSPAPTAVSPSDPAETTESSSVASTGGGGTGP